MIEKRFLDLLEQYKQESKNINYKNKNTIDRLKYINQCLDHLENEIEDLNLDLDKPENKIYKEMENVFSPLMLAYLVEKN